MSKPVITKNKPKFEDRVKNFEFSSSVKTDSVNEQEHTAEFVLSTNHIDRHGEVVDQDTWELENFMNAPRLLLQHESNSFPIGRWENLRIEEENGVKSLIGTAKFAYKEYDKAKTAFDLVKGGYLNTVSVGFRSKRWEFNEDLEAWVSYDNELLECSLVSIPANANALMKSFETKEDEPKEEAIKEELEEIKEDLNKSITVDELNGVSAERKKQAKHLILKAIRKMSK